MRKEPAPVAAVAALLYGATLWGVVWYPLRLLEAAGLGGVWITFVSYAAALLAGLPLARGWRAVARNAWGAAALALTAGWCNLAFVLAMLEGTVVRVLLLFYLAPAWAALLGWLFLGERPGARGVAMVAAALAGAVVMLWEPAAGMPLPAGRADWLALSAGLAFAAANVCVRGLATVPLGAKAVLTWAGVAGLAGLAAAWPGTDVPAADAAAWAGAVALGLVGLTTMTLAVQYGVERMPVHRSAVILLFELVAGAVSAAWLAHEGVALREWLGGALIVAAALVAARGEAGGAAMAREARG